MPKTFRVSDESINSYKCRVLNTGADTTAFESNPVMLFMHLRGNVIGRWENLRLENGEWLADAVFDMDDERPCGGKEIGGKVERGFINAASFGIGVWDVDYNPELECYDITRWTLQEISIVDIGSNHNALQLYDKAGEPITELKLASYLEQFKPKGDSTTKPNPSISTPQTTMELKTIALAMGLPETATEQDVLAKAAKGNAAITDLEGLQLTMKTNQANEANQLVQAAIDDKRISATAKDAYLKLFTADHESAKAVLAGLPKPQNLTTLATNGQAVATLALSDQEARVKKYDELDQAGKLMQLAQSDRASFESLFEAKFGKKPDRLQV